MKVYVITSGEYSDYHICGVALEREKAEELARKFTGNYRYEEAYIEEYDTDFSDEILRHDKIYSCFYDTLTETISVNDANFAYAEQSDFLVTRSTRGSLHVCVFALDKESAIKISSEKFAKFMAEEMGL